MYTMAGNFEPYDGPDANAKCCECLTSTLRVVRCTICNDVVCGECVSEHKCDVKLMLGKIRQSQLIHEIIDGMFKGDRRTSLFDSEEDDCI